MLSVFDLVTDKDVCVSIRARADGTVGLPSICFGDISGQGIGLLLMLTLITFKCQ